MKLVDVSCLKKLISKVGLLEIFDLVISRIEQDYKNWDGFEKKPRHATHSELGVIELMPISDSEYYGFKYVNGHPNNPLSGKLSVMALGMLARIEDGEPLMMCEMTLLTAIRTACASAVAAKYCARKNSSSLGIIGAGAQAEFQIIALSRVFNLTSIIGYDINPSALDKTKKNLERLGIDFNPVASLSELMKNIDILTTETAAKKRDILFSAEDVPLGCHINAIGGDCPGKTELDINQFVNATIVVEYYPQTLIEGEIQQLNKDIPVYELHQVVKKNIMPRQSDDSVTIFDSVGFALEDYSALRVIYDLALEYDCFMDGYFIPKISDPKDLFSALVDVI